MTEQEIVEYLKKNRTKGVLYLFMPEEVKDWCFYKKEEYCNDFLLLKPNYEWVKVSDDFSLAAGYYAIALPEDFKLREKPEGGWVEFDITDKGLFFLEYTDRGGSNVSHRFYWHQWSQFLEYCDIDELKYTAFGGWQYPNSSYWSTYPQVKTGRGDNYSSYYCEREQGEDYEINPAIPVKIRFWREKK